MPNPLTITKPNDHEAVVTREFDAPRELVWESIYRPELLKRWFLGPPGWEMTVCEDDARTGGTFRRVWSDSNGKTRSQSGVYREVVPPERCVRTQVFAIDGVQWGKEQVVTINLAESAGKTVLTMAFRFDSKEERDESVVAGMEKGMGPMFDRLDQVLESVSA